jgi:hypothetical protein
LVSRIVASRYFEHSARLRDFLLYVFQRSLENPSACTTEREIGCKVFGRPADFDPTDDTIVRVHASRLRRSLDQYFSAEGRDEPLILKIPRGGYNPVWETRNVPVQANPSVPPRARSRNTLVLTLTVLSAVLALVCAALAVQNRTLRGSLVNREVSPTPLHRFWKQVWANDRPTCIVLSDSNLSLWNDMTGRSLTLSEYLARAYESSPAGDGSAPIHMVMQRQYTSFVSALIASRLARLAPATAEVLFARETTPRQLQISNVILVGSRRSNPWVESFERTLQFRARGEKAGAGPSVDNLSPQPGEPLRYEAGHGHGYAHVAFVPNISGNGNVVLFAGTEAQSSEAAANFMTTERGISELLRLLRVAPGKPFPFFELVLQTTTVGATGTESKIATYRVIDLRR